jgi:hypothetical protein
MKCVDTGQDSYSGQLLLAVHCVTPSILALESIQRLTDRLIMSRKDVEGSGCGILAALFQQFERVTE